MKNILKAKKNVLLVMNASEGRVQSVLAECTPRTHENAVQGADLQLAPAFLCSFDLAAPTKGTEMLAPQLRMACALCKHEIADIQYIACVNGPGSFTGIRLTLATAAALRRSTGALLAPLDAMHGLACGASLPENAFSKPPLIWVITHARQEQVHVQTFLPSAHALPEPAAPYPTVKIVSLDQCAHALENIPGHTNLVLGSGIRRNHDFFQDFLQKNFQQKNSPLFLPEHFDTLTPIALYTLAQNACYTPADLDPYYVRPCDAIENLDHIARKQGMNPKTAHEKLTQLLRKDCS